MSTDRVDPNSAGSLLRAMQAVPVKQVWLPTRISPRWAKGRSDSQDGFRADREFSTSIRSSFQNFAFSHRYYARDDCGGEEEQQMRHLLLRLDRARRLLYLLKEILRSFVRTVGVVFCFCWR